MPLILVSFSQDKNLFINYLFSIAVFNAFLQGLDRSHSDPEYEIYPIFPIFACESSDKRGRNGASCSRCEFEQ